MLLYPLPALADYHYASHTGSNEYPYTSWATAADSIQKAIDAASPHDTVYVGSGEYHEQVTINRDSIALIGMGYDSTLVWYAENQLETITATPNMYWTIFVEGIHVQNRTNFWAFSGSTRNNLHLNRCRFSHPQDLTDEQELILRPHQITYLSRIVYLTQFKSVFLICWVAGM
jgi:hypothetical protein